MKAGDVFYTKEGDGTIQKWYVWGCIVNTFAVSARKNDGFNCYRRFYSISDIGKTIFRTRKEAKNADPR